MDKAEVLERSRMENRHGDERDRGITIESGTWGAVSLAAATAVVFLARLLSKGGAARLTCSPSSSHTSRRRMPTNGVGQGPDGRSW